MYDNFLLFHERRPHLNEAGARLQYRTLVKFSEAQLKLCGAAWRKNDAKRLSAKQKRVRSHGSGRKPTAISPSMDKTLRALVNFLRGPRPKKKEEEKEEKKEEEEKEEKKEEEKEEEEKSEQPPPLDFEEGEPIQVVDGDDEDPLFASWDESAVVEVVDLTSDEPQRVDLTTRRPLSIPKTPAKRAVNCRVFTLVWQLRLRFPNEFKQKSVKAWYHAVYRWCKRNKLSLRRVNRKHLVNKPEMAQAIRELRRRIQEYIEQHQIHDQHIFNLDETALDIFNLECLQYRGQGVQFLRCTPMVQTLHYTCAKRVLGNKANKLCLSMPAVWRADGHLEFVVIWYARA